jgi:NAD(P)-dependent dehydrogenase (short-subunit alcohol dehydrogenase family)
MSKKTILISGATSGLGKQALLELSQKGHRVIVVSRNREKMNATVEMIKFETNNADIFCYQADFSDADSVKNATQKIAQEHPAIDVLINNAGALHIRQERTESGVEKTMMVNYYSHFILTMGLLDNLRSSGKSTIINVSSDCYKLPGYAMNEPTIDDEKYNFNKAYNRSKLAQIQFTRMLKERLSSDDITVTCVSPGGVKTDIYAPMPKILRWLVTFSLKPVSKGVRDIVNIALDDDASRFDGEFVSNTKIKPIHSRYLDKQQMLFLWEQSEAFC